MAKSVLETFFIMFASNADEVDEANDKARKSTDDLEESLDDSKKASDNAGKSFLRMSKSAVGALSSILALAGVAFSVTSGSKYAEDLRLSSLAIGENIGEIEAWGKATREFGGDSASFQSVLKGLNNSIRETAFTGEGTLSPVLRRLGLNLRDLEGNIKTPLQLLPEIAKAFEGMDPAESLHLGGMLGLDDATIMLLQKGRSEVDLLIRKQKEFGVLNERDAEIAKQFNYRLNEFSNIIVSIRQRITTAVLPAMTSFLDRFKQIGSFIENNGPLVEGFFLAVAGVVGAIYIPMMIKAAAATLAATWPILLIIGIIAALAAAFALAYDEVVNFANGGNSLIGEAVKRWPLLGVSIDIITGSIRTLLGVFSGLSSFISSAMDDPIGASKKFFEGWADGVRQIIESVPLIGGSLLKIFDFFMNIFSSIAEVIGFVIGMISDATQKASSLFPSFNLFDAVNSPFKDSSGGIGILDKARSMIGMASSTPLASQTSNSVVNSFDRRATSNVVLDGDIVIQTQATDAEGISSAIGSSLTEQLRQAMYNFDDGVRS